MIWKPVLGYEGLYEVNELGNVRSLNYNHTGKPRQLCLKDWHGGYCGYTLSKNGKTKNKYAHILVAEAFIDNPNGKPCVNHIDGNKRNNSAKNLEWVTKAENTQHAILNGLRKDSNMRGITGVLNKNSKKVQQIKDGVVIKVWDCVSDAARFYNCSPCSIINCSAGRIKSCKGYQWSVI